MDKYGPSIFESCTNSDAEFVPLTEEKLKEAIESLKPLQPPPEGGIIIPEVDLRTKYNVDVQGLALLNFLEEFWGHYPDHEDWMKQCDYGYLACRLYLIREDDIPDREGITPWERLKRQILVLIADRDNLQYLADIAEKDSPMDNLMEMELKAGLRKLDWKRQWRTA